MKHLLSLVFILICVVSMTAQISFPEKPKYVHAWIALGTYQGASYEADPFSDNKEFAWVRNVLLSGKYSGYYVVQKLKLNCKDNMIRFVEQEFYNDKDILIYREEPLEPFVKVDKNSFLDQQRDSMMERWCK